MGRDLVFFVFHRCFNMRSSYTILSHHHETGYPVTFNNFNVISTANFESQLLLRETMFIRALLPFMICLYLSSFTPIAVVILTILYRVYHKMSQAEFFKFRCMAKSEIFFSNLCHVWRACVPPNTYHSF